MTKVLNTEIRRLVFELDLYFKNRQLCIGISFFILLTVNKPYIGIQLILKHKQMVLHYFIIKLQMVIDLENQFITLIRYSIYDFTIINCLFSPPACELFDIPPTP